MKRTLLITLTIYIVCTSLAMAEGPILSPTNPQPGATLYQLTGPSWLPASIPATSGTFRLDLGPIAQPGTYSITSKACKVDPLWGIQCGPVGNYTLTCYPPVTFVAPILGLTDR